MRWRVAASQCASDRATGTPSALELDETASSYGPSVGARHRAVGRRLVISIDLVLSKSSHVFCPLPQAEVTGLQQQAVSQASVGI